MASQSDPPPGSDATVSVTEVPGIKPLEYDLVKKEKKDRAVTNQVQFRVLDGVEYFICNWTNRLIPRAFVEPLRNTSKRKARNAFMDIGCLVAFVKQRALHKESTASYKELLNRIARFYGIGPEDLPLPCAPDPALLDHMTISEYQKLYMPESLLKTERILKLSLTPEEFRERHGNKRGPRKRAASGPAAEPGEERAVKRQDNKSFHVYRQMPNTPSGLQLTQQAGGGLTDLVRSLKEELPQATAYQAAESKDGGLLFWQSVPAPRGAKNFHAQAKLLKPTPVFGPALHAEKKDSTPEAAEGEGEVSDKTSSD